MRIGLFTDAYLPDINGVVSSVATLKHALEELGHTVFIITNHKGVKIAEDEDGHILRLPGLEIKKFYGYKMSIYGRCLYRKDGSRCDSYSN
jgi:1,2-diacylglycerol 3-alpha-glucosyltransferase